MTIVPAMLDRIGDVITTAMGSMPGTDFDYAIHASLDCFDLAFWPELVQAGRYTSMIARAACLMEIPCCDAIDGWRLSSHRDAMIRRARQQWADEIEITAQAAEHFEGRIKIAFAGPWTLAAQILLPHPTMNHVLADLRACRDLAQALGEGIASHCARIASAIPQPLIIQIDEPCLPAVLGGNLSRFSTLERYPIPERNQIIANLASVIEPVHAVKGVEQIVVHSCAGLVSTSILADAGADTVAADLDTLSTSDRDVLGEWISADNDVYLGVMATHTRQPVSIDDVVSRALAWIEPMQIDPTIVERHVVITPACGMGTWSTDQAWKACRTLREAADLISENLRR